MTDVKISALSAKATPDGTEEVPLNDGGTNKKMTLANLVSLVTRGTLGLATSDTPQFTGIEVGAASDTTLTRASAGNLAVEGNALYRAGGTDVPVADGGTGSSTAAGAATNLGLGTGDSPQFTAVNVGHATDTTLARASAGNLTVEGNALYRAGGTDVPVVDGGTGASDSLNARANLGIPTQSFNPAFLVDTTPRAIATTASATLTTGKLLLTAITLPKDFVITSITFMSGGSALVTGTHQIFGIFDDNQGSSSGTARALLRSTTDDTSTAWAATTFKTLGLTSTYTTTRAGTFYIGITVAATTVPSIACTPAASAVFLGGGTNTMGGLTSDTGLTALPNPAGAITNTTNVHWAGVS